MVEVTRSNFSYIFPIIEKSIVNSTFIAIDAEFTGLTLGPSNENNLFDSMPERYEKLRCRATSFIPCQIGLSTFTKDLEKNSYSVETFVFYIRPYMIGNIDRRFTCQASALDFLCGYNFDFKKLLPEGIPYINENEEMQVRQELKDGSISLPHEKIQDPRYQVKINEIINEKFGKYQKYKPEISKEKVYIPVDTKSHVYFQLREIRRKFPKLWAYAYKDSIVVKMVSLELRKRLEGHEVTEQESVLDYFLGFTKVFRLLKNCQKPIVGHNLLMDLMLFYQNFHHHLPDSYEKFKKEIHSVFPVIYDTKYIWMNIRLILGCKRNFAGSGLPALYELFKNPPDHLNTLFSPYILPSNCKQYVDEDFVHDSGYDAFITGFVFLKICHILAMENSKLLIPKDKPPTFKHLLSASSSYANKINFPFFKFKYINLEGADPLPDLPNYLYISFKDGIKTLTLDELNMRFSKYQIPGFKFIKLRRAAIVVIQNVNICNRLLQDFKDDPDLIVENYNFLKHSPYVSATIWLTIVASGCFVAAWIWKSH